jgi:hypothetical protein
MDHQFFQDTQAQLPAIQANSTVFDYIQDYVTTPQEITAEYFQKVHWWMPIISRQRLLDQTIPAPSQNSDIDTLLLKLAMRTLLWNPSQQPQRDGPRSEVYLVAKHAISESITMGVLTLQLLQAQFLLAIYELGHAIVGFVQLATLLPPHICLVP